MIARHYNLFQIADFFVYRQPVTAIYLLNNIKDSRFQLNATRALRNMATTSLILDGSVSKSIAQALSKLLPNSTYACGGTIKVAPSATQPSSAEPITIRWDSATSIEKITLPLAAGDHESVEKLVAGTQPASFGFQGQDVIDETYRKASKLDTSAFSTNFCPYEAGIIDDIDQALLPKVPSSAQGIRAELYKLNVSLT